MFHVMTDAVVRVVARCSWLGPVSQVVLLTTGHSVHTVCAAHNGTVLLPIEDLSVDNSKLCLYVCASVFQARFSSRVTLLRRGETSAMPPADRLSGAWMPAYCPPDRDAFDCFRQLIAAVAVLDACTALLRCLAVAGTCQRNLPTTGATGCAQAISEHPL